jgi:ribokinase
VDATAAGDVFNGALAQALSEGKSILDAAGFANAAAAIAVTRLGAQSSAPTRADIERLLAPKIPISSSQPNGSPSRAPWKKAARLEI